MSRARQRGNSEGEDEHEGGKRVSIVRLPVTCARPAGHLARLGAPRGLMRGLGHVDVVTRRTGNVGRLGLLMVDRHRSGLVDGSGSVLVHAIFGAAHEPTIACTSGATRTNRSTSVLLTRDVLK